jgi:hypothetical protein
MNDPENFIGRWSRRKREAANEDAQAERPAAPASEKESRPDPLQSAQPVPEFDISSLPPIETIDAGTDITAFLRPGVPAALRHAALRRAWSADPAIRDFMGLNENFWDAAGPDGVPGFGDLDPNLDVNRLVSEIFGETPREEPAQEASQQHDPFTNPDDERTSIPPSEGPLQPDVETPAVSQGSENVAMQKSAPDSVSEKRTARRHGGALPQ